MECALCCIGVMRVSSLGLRSRLLALILVAVVPSAILSIALAARERNAERQAAQLEALRLARLAAMNEEQLIAGARQLLVALARLPQIRDGDPAVCNPFLKD